MSATQALATPALAVDTPVENNVAVPSNVAEQAPVDASQDAEASPAPEVETSLIEEPKVEDVRVEEEKKEKKSRKPFADLLNKIRRPSDRPSEKKEIPEVTVAPPASELPAVESSTAPEEAAAIEAAAEEQISPEHAATEEPAAQEEITSEEQKDAASPRKERGNLFEKIHAFVLKPKSPKPKKGEAAKTDREEVPVHESVPAQAESSEPAALTEVPVSPTQEATSSPVDSPVSPAPEGVPAIESALPKDEPAEEPKVTKKEKSPKDLAKLARRFSGRLFGNGEKKKEEKATRPEATKEEVAEAAETTEAAQPSESEIQTSVPVNVSEEPASEETAPESSSQPSEPVPVIAAAA